MANEIRVNRKLWVEQEQGKHFCHCGCGKPIKISIHHRGNGISLYLRGHHPLSRNNFSNDEADFWSFVQKLPDDACWMWNGSKNELGYGRFCFRGKMIKAHRLSYFFTYGNWPTNLACHRCDNPSCVRPDHIFDGTQADNVRDAAIKGRLAQKFTAEKVKEVVDAVRRGLSLTEAGKLVGMSCHLVSGIIRGHQWSHITGIKKGSSNGQ